MPKNFTSIKRFLLIFLPLLLVVIGTLGFLYYQGLKVPTSLSFSLFPLEEEPKLKLATSTLSIGAVTLEVEIADTDEARSLGLSNRRRLPEGKGMLFIFDKPGFYGFWMKDMKFPIDIVWLDEDWKVVDLTENFSPLSYPKTVIPVAPVQYVLEIPARYSTKAGITVGESAKFID